MKKAALCLFLTATSFAQRPPEIFPLGPVNPAVPTPRSVLGYDIGERFTDYRNLERYIEKLAGASDRIKRVIYGETYEHRPLQVLIVSSPQNLARLDEVRTANLRLTDPRGLKSGSEAETIINSLPVIVWLSYGVHGNESCSPEAAILTMYQLCAGSDRRTQAILDNVITVIDPAVNPDGRERYVHWANTVASLEPNSNPEAMEHSEGWPSGRTNHYFFDLNRDWSWQTQQESRARIKLYREWMPHVHVDYHEMGYTSTYFFFPATAPFHEAFPEEVKKWGKIFGQGNAEAFDKLGIPYYVGEHFDLFYPGYGDSWPTFNGAIGMTYEQAGGGRGGIAIAKPSGHVLTLRERARNHFVTGIATLETAEKNRKERLQDFLAYWRTAIEPAGPVKGYIIKDDPDPPRAARLVSLLMSQGIEVHQLRETAQLEAQKFFTRKAMRESFPKGTYFVPLAQPESRLTRALLEPQSSAKDTFFYDISAWSLPVAYGLQAYTTQAGLPSNAAKLVNPPSVEGRVVGGKAGYAYLIPWERNDAVKVVWQLLEKGYELSYATRRFETANRDFIPGTVVALVGMNGDSLHADIARLSSSCGVDVYAANTGLTGKGISLGSDRIRPMKKASIAVLTDSPVNSSEYGELWFLFERQYGIPFTAIRGGDLKNANLERYDVFIIPQAGDLKPVLDSANVERLKGWVRKGGVLIALDNAARFLTKTRSGFTGAVLTTDKKDEDKTKDEKDQEKAKKEMLKRLTLFEKEESERLSEIPGTIFKVLVDTTHPVGFGMPGVVYVFKGDGTPIELTESGHTVARFSKDTTEVAGYAPIEKTRRIAETGFIQDFRMGRGHTVLFAEDITFRMFWIGLEKFLLNTVLFLPEPGS